MDESATRKRSAEGVGGQTKVAIPRAGPAPQPPARRRIGRACQVCRERKIKCSGQKPTCEQCATLGVDCIYVSSEREKREVQIEQLKRENELFRSLLMKLAGRGGSIADEINQTLGTVQKKRRRDSGSSRRGSSSSLSSVGSLDAIDVVNEDVNRSEESRATGFVGKNSEVSWLQSLDIETERVNPDQTRLGKHSSDTRDGNYIASKSYHTEDRPMTEPEQLDPYETPPKHVAKAYYDAFFSSVNPYFPMVRKSLFAAQFERYYTEPFLNPGNKWLAVLNMVFAIGSRYCTFAGKEVPDESEHTIFFLKAKMLSANENIIYSHPDLQQVQIETLLAFYFLALSQVNRSWKLMNIASASAVSLGINMHSVDKDIDYASKESRCRLWCSLLMLERSLTTITGRPSTLDHSFSVQAPLPFPESAFSKYPESLFLNNALEREKVGTWSLFEDEAHTKIRAECLKSMQPNQSLFFHYQVDLSLIASAITKRIYGVHALQEGRGQVERAIEFYGQKLDRWLSTIHDQFSFIDESGELIRTISSREQVGLALYFYSTCILLHRPCLSRPGIRGRSGIRLPRSRFGNNTAVICIRSALYLLDIFPDEPSEHWFYYISPWWTTLHFMMQAMVVLLIHLTVGDAPVRSKQSQKEGRGPAHSFNSSEAVLANCKKVLRWLYHMASTDSSCKQGFEICHRLIHRIPSLNELILEGIPSPSALNQDPPNNPIFSGGQPTELSEDLGYVDFNSSFATQDSSIGGYSSEVSPLNLLAGSDISWFPSLEELDQIRVPYDDLPGWNWL